MRNSGDALAELKRQRIRLEDSGFESVKTFDEEDTGEYRSPNARVLNLFTEGHGSSSSVAPARRNRRRVQNDDVMKENGKKLVSRVLGAREVHRNRMERYTGASSQKRAGKEGARMEAETDRDEIACRPHQAQKYCPREEGPRWREFHVNANKSALSHQWSEPSLSPMRAEYGHASPSPSFVGGASSMAEYDAMMGHSSNNIISAGAPIAAGSGYAAAWRQRKLQ